MTQKALLGSLTKYLSFSSAMLGDSGIDVVFVTSKHNGRCLLGRHHYHSFWPSQAA